MSTRTTTSIASSHKASNQLVGVDHETRRVSALVYVESEADPADIESVLEDLRAELEYAVRFGGESP